MAVSILLVDDDPHILETACDILEAAGFEVRTAETGKAAQESLQVHARDLMIVDFNLLDMTGLELAVKARAIAPQLKIILMTGEAHVELGPAKDIICLILTKPVNPAELIRIVKGLVEA